MKFSNLVLPFSVVAGALVIAVGGAFLLRQTPEAQPALSPATAEELPYADFEPPEGWKTYRNEEFGFEVRYPGNAEMVDISSADGDGIRVDLLPSHTEIVSKYFISWIRSNDFAECLEDRSFYSEVGNPVVITNHEFFVEYSPEILANGAIADDRNYFGIREDFCVYLTFGFEYRSERRDWADEEKVFGQILSTFRFTE